MIKLRRSNTLGRYDRPNSVAGDCAPVNPNGLLSSFTSMTYSSKNPTLTVCLDCKQAVESMKNQSEENDFYQRRRASCHQDFSGRRAIVTKSLIFD